MPYFDFTVNVLYVDAVGTTTQLGGPGIRCPVSCAREFVRFYRLALALRIQLM